MFGEQSPDLEARGSVKKARQQLPQITRFGVGKQVLLGLAGAAAVDVGFQALADPAGQGRLHIRVQICLQVPFCKPFLPDVPLHVPNMW